jgi:hypothetical protein
MLYPGLTLEGTGIPNRKELISMYSQSQTQCSLLELLQWRGFYLTFLLFKNCVIIQGVAQREKNGLAVSPMAKKGMFMGIPIFIHDDF